MTDLTVIIADDHPLFRGAMRHAVSGLCEQVTIIEAETFETARRSIAAHPDVDLLLLDLSMPGMNSMAGLMALRAEYDSVPVVIVSAHDDNATVRRVLDLGASGFISKSATIDQIRSSIRTVLEGDIAKPDNLDTGRETDPEIADLLRRLRTLTPQQTRVLGMLGEGLLNKQIAYELSVSEATVKAHVSAILLKLNVDSRTQAVIQMSKLGAVPVA